MVLKRSKLAMEEKARMMIMAVLLVLSSAVQSSHGWSSCYCDCPRGCRVVKHYDPYDNCFCYCECGGTPRPTPSPPETPPSSPEIPPPQLPPPQNPPPQEPPPENPPPQQPSPHFPPPQLPPPQNPPPQLPPPHNSPPQQPPHENPPPKKPEPPPEGDVPPNCPKQPPGYIDCFEISEEASVCLIVVSNMVGYYYDPQNEYIQNCCNTVGQFMQYCGNPFMLNSMPQWLQQICHF